MRAAPLAFILLSAVPPSYAADALLSVLPEGATLEARLQPGADPLPPYAWTADLESVAYAALKGERRLLVLGERSLETDAVLYLGYAPDGKTLVSVCREGDWEVLRFGRAERARHEALRPPRWSGKRMVYAASDRGREFIVDDGSRGPESDVVGDPVFSPDGKRLAYWRRAGPSAELWLDGAKAGAWTAPPEPGLTGFETPVFSPDGKRLAFAKRGADGLSSVVVDGKEGPGWSDAGQPLFSPDGRSWMHSASTGTPEAGLLVVDGLALGSAPDRPELAYERVWPYRFNAAGRPVYVAGLAGNRELLVEDGRSLGPFLSAAMPVSGPGGREAFAARDEGGAFVVLDGVRQASWTSVGQLAFSEAGELCYVAGSSGGAVVVLGAAAGPRHDEVASLVLSGKDSAYWARDGGLWRVYVNGKAEGPSALRPGLLLAAGPGRWARTYADEQGWKLALGERTLGPFDEIGPTRWFPGERRLAAGVRRGRELWRRELKD